MYIAPNTELHILRNVPLNKSYENTVYYPSAGAQATAFLNYNKYTLTNYSYQRQALGTIRVELKYEQLYDCNYLMFKNSNFENKWFYCFITGVAYISNEVSEIYYEMDVMQTWAYDYNFLDTFVERRHSTNDTLYENTQPEGLELGSSYGTIASYFYPLTREVGDRGIPSEEEGKTESRMWYVLLCTEEVPGAKDQLDMEYRTYSLCGNVFTGLYIYSTKNPYTVVLFLGLLNKTGQTASLINFYIAPCNPFNQLTKIVDETDTSWSKPKSHVETHDLEFNRAGNLFQGYTPKNKKLLGWPFSRFRVSNNCGLDISYHPEYFGDSTSQSYATEKMRFRVELSAFPQPTAKVLPLNYQIGSTNESSIIYGNFPTCATNSDTFQIWLAQNKNNYIATMNSIQSSYDTNRAIAQNNYSMAQRSANASAMMSSATINAGLANATATNNTALSNAQRSAMGGYAGAAVGAVGDLFDLSLGGLAKDAMSAVNTTINWQNAQDSTNTAQSNAANSAATALANADLAKSTALKNASTSQASASLSALTAKNNATAMLVAKKEDMENVPNTVRGNAMCDAMNYSDLTAGFYFFHESVRPEYAKVIDDYFTCYGYAQNKLYRGSDLDTRINRPHYSYLKTVGCSIKGRLNSNDEIAIQSIYDNGITTWDTLEDVGNYELDNAPKA